MAEGKLLVVVIRTPKSDRYLPIESLFKDDQRFKLEYIEASMTPSYSEVSNRTIAYSAELFEYFQGRKLTPAEIGCADSHNRARDLIKSHADGGVIMEDDARIINIDSFFKMATDFLLSQKSKLSILNLTGFRNIGLETSRNRSMSNNRYVKLWGYPDLAVSYALTQRAAGELLKSNTPIMGVSDWPHSKCYYFVPLIPLVLHGDKSTQSIIEPSKNTFRVGKSLTKKLIDFLFIKFFINKPKNIKLINFIRYIYIEKINWHVDYFRIKIKLGFIK
jgi:GR25 family glycosyltransferase involved in LPS biosynthesis